MVLVVTFVVTKSDKMASLRKRKSSSVWVACFTDKEGKRKQRSTGIEDDGTEETKRKALDMAATFERSARALLTARQVDSVLRDTYEGAREAAQLSRRSVRNFFDYWTASKKGEVADSTLKFYQSAKNKFLKFLGTKADEDLALISKDDILEFRADTASSLTSTTVNHNLKAVRMVFRAAMSEGLITQNPAEFVKTLKHTPNDSNVKRRPFTAEELKKLLEVADEEWRSMILFGLYTGQRLGDISLLKWENIDFDEGFLVGFTTQKTGRAMNVPVADSLLRELKPRIPRDGKLDKYIHPQAATVVKAQGKSGTLSRQFYDLMAKAGIVEKKPHRKNEREEGEPGMNRVAAVSFHSLRHTMTSLLHNAGVGSAVAQELVGHDSPAIHQVYTHLNRSTLKKAINLLPDYVGS